jgi:hypothetical protein
MRIEADGDDAQAAVDKLAELFATGLRGRRLIGRLRCRCSAE